MNVLRKILVTGFALAIFSNPFTLAKTQATNTTIKKETLLEEKIEKYKKFKSLYEDKDFLLKSYHVERYEAIDGETKRSSFDNYHIAYGIIEDNFRGYRGKSKRYIQIKGKWYLEDLNRSIIHPKITLLEDVKNLPYPVSLVFKTLSEEESKMIIAIYSFNDGDIDIHFTFGKESDKNIVEPIYQKLKKADEKNDEKKPKVKMEPIIPTKNQWLLFSTLPIDEDRNGEPDHVLIPYCIDGSCFDNDLDNNRVQVGLKYRLVTKKDLEGKKGEERKYLEERMGCWIWDKPGEILIDFDEAKAGPDIIFYDIGKVKDGTVIDEEPDGKFDKYEFLD